MHVMRPALILYAAYASLLYLIVYSAEVCISIFHPGTGLAPVHILEILLSIVAYAGWMEAGRRFKNQLLLNVSLIAVFLVPASGVLNSMLSYLGSLTIFYSIVSSFVLGLLVTVFGASLLRLPKDFGDLARVTGWLDIVMGLCLLSFILLPVAAVLMPPVLVLEAILLFKAYKKASRKGLPGISGIWHKIF